MTVNLHIDRLVIDGLKVGSRDAPVVERALSAELTRQILEGGTAGFSRTCTEPLIRTAPIVELSDGAEWLGTNIARAIYEGIRE